MSWNPFSTLTGRLVLVTFGAVLASLVIGVVLYTNERGTELRRVALNSAVERIAFNAERLRDTPPSERPARAQHFSEIFIHYRFDDEPSLEEPAPGGSRSARIARVLSERLQIADIRVHLRITRTDTRDWMRESELDLDEFIDRRDSSVSVTELTVSTPLGDNTWLNARAFLPGPTRPPVDGLWGVLAMLVVVGLGSALVARQIGKPLAHLASAAQALGAGQTNVTAPVSGPQDVRRASTAFNAMAQRLGRQLQRQRQMLWALSHDLRTPITALRLRAELIEDDATRQRVLAPIEEMERLTEQALELARAGASEEERSVVDIAEIVRTLCGELQDIGVNVSAEAPHPVMVAIRPSEIARALRNLAENAAKYAGSGVMRVKRNGDVIVEVIDDGPGVPPDMLSRLTEPFFRADAARSEANGAGLGLSISQAIADSHGGSLILENRTPRGFSAKIVLPAQRD